MASSGTGPRTTSQPSWQCCAGQPRALISQLRLGPGPVVRIRCPPLLSKQWDVPCPPAAGLSGLGTPSVHYRLPLALQPLPELHPGQEQPEVCRHAHHPDHLHQQPQPHGLRLQAGENREGLGWLWTSRNPHEPHPKSCWGGGCPQPPKGSLDCVMSAHLPPVPGTEEVGGISHVFCGISPGDGETKFILRGARSPGFDPIPGDVPVLSLVFS